MVLVIFRSFKKNKNTFYRVLFIFIFSYKSTPTFALLNPEMGHIRMKSITFFRYVILDYNFIIDDDYIPQPCAQNE